MSRWARENPEQAARIASLPPSEQHWPASSWRPAPRPRRLRYVAELQDSSDRGMWHCLRCDGTLLYSVISGQWTHYNPDSECVKVTPSHRPSDRHVETGRWP